MNQLSLFAQPGEPVWRPDPERVRARLDRILAEARDPAAPLDAATLSLFRTIVPDMLRLLPEPEAAARRAALDDALAARVNG
jgi:hypothetical protein